MAFFIATGTISNDIVRRETRNGVLATFRLETATPRGGKLWIDVECWGHLAGTIAHHGAGGRPVCLSGRLAQKTWRDKATGDARRRYVVTAADIDLLPADQEPLSLIPNSVLLHGTIDHVLPPRQVTSGTISRLRISDGRAGSKTGRLNIDVEHWTSGTTAPLDPPARSRISAIGGLTFQPGAENSPSTFALSARALAFA